MLKLLKLITILSVVFINGAYAQDKNKTKLTDQPVFVRANVAVYDSKEAPINDLKQEDFKIFEDGVEQKITYFKKKEPILNLGLVFDNSGSMRTYLETVNQMNTAFVNILTPKDQAFVTRFVSSDKIEILQDWTSDKRKLINAGDQMYAEGGQTAVLDAVYLAAEKFRKEVGSDEDARSAIILVSDCEDRDSYYKFEDVKKLFIESDIQVFVISFADVFGGKSNIAHYWSDRFSLETGGTTHYLQKKMDSQALSNMIIQTIGEIRARYVIGYTSTNTKNDGAFRKLSVQTTKGADEKVRTAIRAGFTVPKT